MPVTSARTPLPSRAPTRPGIARLEPLSRDRGSLLLIPRDEGKSSYGRAGRALSAFGQEGMK
jgi:hypothetical protein